MKCQTLSKYLSQKYQGYCISRHYVSAYMQVKVYGHVCGHMSGHVYLLAPSKLLYQNSLCWTSNLLASLTYRTCKYSN